MRGRLLAVLVAVGLIVGAVVVRRALDDDVGDATAAGGGGGETRLICAAELRDACASLDGVDVLVEDAAATADRLSTAAAAAEGSIAWAVAAPWPEIVDDSRSRVGLDPLFRESLPVARSPLVAVGAESLDGCGWRCLGDGAGDDLDLGAPSPTSGLGLLQVGAFASGWFGSSDFAANDFDGALTSWLAAIGAATTPTDDPVTRLLQSRAFFDVALSFEAEAQRAFDAASADRRAGLALLYPAPVAYLDVLVVEVGEGSDALRNAIGDALVQRGWQSPSDDGPNLPRAGVLVALKELV